MKSKILFFCIGFLLSFIAFTFIRFVNVKGESHTHFHANIAIFIEGNRVDLSADKYMEEISSCSASQALTPRQRVHLHQNNPDAVHIHHDGVTWGHFLLNIGFNSGANYISDDKGNIYQNTDSKNVTYILNGDEVTTIANRAIKSEDRLLINYGSESIEELINSKFTLVENNAGEFNKKPDPASCSGEEKLTFGEKLRQALFGQSHHRDDH